MLIIRHRTGPLAGKDRQVEPASDRIVFGRDPNACDVVFPPDATIVARRHFALVRKPSREWTIDLFGDRYVALNGKPADLGAAVKSGAVIQLGDDKGPSFEVIVPVADQTDMLEKTSAQKHVKGSRAAAADAERAAARARWMAVAGAAVALLAAGGVGAVIYVQGAADRQFAQALAELRVQQERLAAESIPREYRDRLGQAAHYVVVRDASGRERWAGTAFPIAPDTFATNAHVAVNRDEAGAGGKLLVRAPGTGGRTWEVVSHKMHPAYRALQSFLTEDPLMVETIKNEDNPFGAQALTAGNSYDVAILKVEGPPLSPTLEIARPDEILNLHAGDPLAYAGYPSENIAGSEVQRLAPTPQVRTGSVTAITDLFTMPAEPAYRRLVHHNLGTTVGTSGSPIISVSGRLVALHNRTNYVSEGGIRVANGVVLAYAQRADLLADLISGRAETTLDAERAYWVKQTANMRRGADVIVPSTLEANKPFPGAKPVPSSEGKFTLSAAERTKIRNSDGEDEMRRRKRHAFRLQRGIHHLFLAYAQRSSPIGLYLYVGGKIVAQREEDRWYPSIAYRAPADGNVEIVVVGPDDDVTYTLTDYVWDAPKS